MLDRYQTYIILNSDLGSDLFQLKQKKTKINKNMNSL